DKFQRVETHRRRYIKSGIDMVDAVDRPEEWHLVIEEMRSPGEEAARKKAENEDHRRGKPRNVEDADFICLRPVSRRNCADRHGTEHDDVESRQRPVDRPSPQPLLCGPIPRHQIFQNRKGEKKAEKGQILQKFEFQPEKGFDRIIGHGRPHMTSILSYKTTTTYLSIGCRTR